MADFSALIQRIKDAVYENGVQAITGQILQDCLKDVVNTVNVAKQDGIYRVTVTVDNNTGVPSATARMDDDTYTLEFSFHNLKGQKGDKGDKGDTPVLTADSDGVIYSDGVMLTRVIKDTTDALTTRADSDHARAESDHARAETDHTDITRARLDAETATSEANYASLRANTAADNADAAREAIQSDLAQKQDVIPDLQQIRAGATDTVKYTSQTLTEAQKEQARTNIGAASDSEVSQLRSDVDELSVELDKQEYIIDESIIKKKSYSIVDFLNGYTNTSSSSIVIGSTFNFVNTTTPMSETSNGGQFHIAVKKGDYVLAKMKSTSNQFCMAYVILDTDRKILSWAGKASNNFNWLANPKRFDIEHDGYLVLQMQRADYSDNVSAPLQIIHGTPVALADLPDQVEEISGYLEGAIINSPTIRNSRAIVAPEGTISGSGACNIYTEIIPSGTKKIWTKFNSYGTPNNIGYAFYDSNDSLLQCGGSLAGSDANKNGVWLGLPVPEGAVKFANTVAYETNYGLVKFDYEGIKTTGLEARVSALEEEVFGDGTYSPKFHLPARLDFIKGEDVLLFKTAMGNSIEPGDIYCKNANCRDFPRYVEVIPTTVGESYIEFNVLNEDAGKVKTANVKLNVFEKPSNPSNTLNILVVGSSTTSNYANQYEELYRRLVLTTGEEGNPSNPKGLGLANVTFVGRKINNGHFRYEATGGYSWGNYADPKGTNNNYAFTVDNPSAFVVGDIYTDGTYDFEISEISQDDNRVSAKCATQNAPIPASGSLSLKTGTGAAALVYSAYVATITHPFDLGNGVSLSDYMDAYCGGVSPDIIVFQDLVFNSGGILTDAIKTKISTLFGIIHTEYPNAKILMSSEALPSLVGGLGTNYKASSAFGQPLVMAWRLRELVSDTISFIDELNESFGSEVVMFVPKTIQCDAEYDYPTTTKAVNFRVTNKEEEIGTNGMHPTAGYGIYNQIDSYYRSIVYAIKKWYN